MKTNEHKQPFMQMCVMMLTEEGVVWMYTLYCCQGTICVYVLSDNILAIINLSVITFCNLNFIKTLFHGVDLNVTEQGCEHMNK